MQNRAGVECTRTEICLKHTGVIFFFFNHTVEELKNSRSPCGQGQGHKLQRIGRCELSLAGTETVPGPPAFTHEWLFPTTTHISVNWSSQSAPIPKQHRVPELSAPPAVVITVVINMKHVVITM